MTIWSPNVVLYSYVSFLGHNLILNVVLYSYVSFLGHNLISQCCPIFLCSIPWTQFDPPMLSYILMFHSLDTIWSANVVLYSYVPFLGHNLIPQCCPIFLCSIPWTQFDPPMLSYILMFHSLDTIWSPNVARYFCSVPWTQFIKHFPSLNF